MKERGLPGRAFRDQNTRLHNATRQDIADLRQDFTGLGQRFDGLQGKFDGFASTQQQIVGMLNTLIDRDSDAWPLTPSTSRAPARR
jgi:hypothetical protein